MWDTLKSGEDALMAFWCRVLRVSGYDARDFYASSVPVRLWRRIHPSRLAGTALPMQLCSEAVLH